MHALARARVYLHLPWNVGNIGNSTGKRLKSLGFCVSKVVSNGGALGTSRGCVRLPIAVDGEHVAAVGIKKGVDIQMVDTPTPLEADLAVARDLAALPDAEQLELIRDATPNRDAASAVAEYRGRGRPPGARNKRNTKFRDQILSLHSHPGVALARAYDRPVELLAAELGCSKEEAFKIQIRAAAELLPYIEGKQPVTLDVRQKHDMVMVLAGGPGVGAAQLEAIAAQVNALGSDGPIDWDGALVDGEIVSRE